MSLINEALKKVQHQRSAERTSGPAGEAASNAPIGKRSQAMRAQTVILLAAAATVLIVFSVVVTVYWVNSSPAPAVAKATVSTPAKPIAPAVTPGPQPIVVPLESKVAVAPTPAAPPPTATTMAATPPASSPANVTTAAAEPANSTVATAPASASEPTANPLPPVVAPQVSTAPTPDPRVQAFVDTVRVAGIRSSGSDSKVLMNDRVYRVNDIVERALGVKLVKVDPDQLTFADVNGLTYTKTF